MPNITLAIPEDLHTKMKERSEIRWSEVVRKSISQKIEDLDVMDKLTTKSKLTQKDVDSIASRIDGAVARKLGLKR
ncbi:MAG TPA: hypothetical protein VJH97_03260 [Candidatus Nanoarchaeia archaeon]|nr:hypothetical protein [Candidatus Nanoarchaeia archaeon]